jgi:uncharacterized SAM-binding protein YcdF (DUF218 family)
LLAQLRLPLVIGELVFLIELIQRVFAGIFSVCIIKQLLVLLLLPLLKGRTNRASRFAWDQERASGKLVRYIPTGGQGPDEHISEAQGMYDYLIEKGISHDRIIMEDKSENTYQNLIYSAELLDKEKEAVGVVTNNFHVFRATKIAQKAGYEKVYGIAARGEPFLQYNNMMREFLGVVKDFLVGNM